MNCIKSRQLRLNSRLIVRRRPRKNPLFAIDRPHHWLERCSAFPIRGCYRLPIIMCVEDDRVPRIRCRELSIYNRRSFRNFIASIRYSIDGFFAALKHEPSFREDLIFAVLLVPLAIILPVNAVSTALMIASLILILIVELLNSAIEATVDRISFENHRLAKRAKDIGSAAVMLSLVCAGLTWLLILFS